MKFIQTNIEGAYIVEIDPIVDERGTFARAFCLKEFSNAGIEFSLAQCNIATTLIKGTTRGLHYQTEPASEQKLVRCTQGRVFDVVVDMRKDSSTYLKVFDVELSPENNRALFIPKGVAHGYQTLENDSVFFYMTDQFYFPEHETGIRYDDPTTNISWPLEPIGVTERDRNWPVISQN